MPRICSACGREDRAGGGFCASCGAKMQSRQLSPDILDSRYEVISLIKSGGMGSVFRALDRRLDCTVAIKQMIASFADRQELEYAEKRFREEATLLSKLHHSGLPKVIDYFSETDRATGKSANYLVMTFIEGQDLDTRLSINGRKPIPVSTALSYFRQILAILIYLHSQSPSVIYRDMKPSNIMIDGEKIFLVDFGIARLFIPSKAATIIGTPGYASPEQYKGFSEPRSDIYSLGVVMHYMLTGQNPEDRDRPPFLFESPRKLNLQVPHYLDELIMSMLEFRPEMRPPSAEKIVQLINDERIRRGNIPVKSALRLTPSLPLVHHTGYSDIFKAVESGDIHAVESFLKAGVDPEITDVDGVSPLHCAAEKGSIEIAELLIDAGAQVNTATKAGCTALHIAAVTGDKPVAELMLARGAQVDRSNVEGRTPLHRASFWGHIELVDLFLIHSAAIDQPDIEGRTALHLAAQEGRASVAEHLIKAGASHSSVDCRSMTPLHLAAQRGQEKTLQVMLKYGASTDRRDEDQSTPLHYAAERGHTAAAAHLLDAGAEVNAADMRGETPLHRASRGKLSTVAYLLKRGADCQIRNLSHMTPLVVALKAEEADIAKLLRLSGSYLDIFEAIEKRDEEAVKIFAENGEHLQPDSIGSAPLHSAAETGETGITALLLRYGAPVNVINRQGETPLHLASRYGHINVVSLLLEHHADPEAKSTSLSTPLHEAAQQGHPDITEILIKAGAQCSCADAKGSSPLHLAAEKGHCSVIELLLRHGAEKNLWNCEGLTPLYQTVLWKRHDAKKQLRSAGGYYDIFEAIRREDLEAVRRYLSVGAPLQFRNRLGQTPLHRMAARDMCGEAERYIAAGAEVNALDRNDATPLHYASRKGYIAMAELLILKGAALCAIDCHKRTPLALALLHRKPEMVKFLRDRGACRDIFDALHHRNTDAVKTFLQTDVNLEEKNAEGSSLLHIAAEEGHIWLVRYLISKGINLNSRDRRGFTPIKAARLAGHRKIVELLRTCRAKGGGPLGLW